MEKANISDQPSPIIMKATSKLSSRGQVVIPAEIRKTLGLAEGDDLTFIVNENGEIKVEITKKYRLSQLIGILKTKQPFRPVEEIRNEAYRTMGAKELKDGEENEVARKLWVDTNVVIRIMTGHPQELAEEIGDLLQKVEAGELILHLKSAHRRRMLLGAGHRLSNIAFRHCRGLIQVYQRNRDRNRGKRCCATGASRLRREKGRFHRRVYRRSCKSESPRRCRDLGQTF
ncbi:AbrB/MazE/SpoVT family DNA-binding domain-containing protein [Geobacillus subterraneus]|uniref:AbrB/MazE/SpoVT family DNA-binding domain-containing protein n=1 Tax=Geobacillus subterraneus TaxID=129338 RepID=UPI00183A0627